MRTIIAKYLSCLVVISATMSVIAAPIKSAKKSQEASFSRTLEGASLPLRSIALPMFVQRPGMSETPLPYVPTLLPGDRLIIRRPAELSADLTVVTAAFNAESRFAPKSKFWVAKRKARKSDDCILEIPSKPSVVVVMVCLHGNGSAMTRMQNALALQPDLFVSKAAEFSYQSDLRSRWNLFFDALQTAPVGDNATNLNEYAGRVSQDLGVRLPQNVDFGSSRSLKDGVQKTAEFLEALRQTNPEELPGVYAKLVAPMVPGTYKDYFDIVYSLYKLAFRPKTEQKLIFSPGVVVMNDVPDGSSQLIAGRAFTRAGSERTVAFMNLPVGRSQLSRILKPSFNRIVLTNRQVIVRVEESVTSARSGPALLGSQYLWNWEIVINGRSIPARFEPGQGVVCDLPEDLWDTFQAADAQVRVHYGPEELLIQPTVRLIKASPIKWSVPAEERPKIVSGNSTWLTLNTSPTEALTATDIENVTFVSSSGERYGAKQFQYDANNGNLRALFVLQDAQPGTGMIEVKLRCFNAPDSASGIWCYASMPGLGILSPRVGDSRLIVEKDASNRVLAVFRENGTLEDERGQEPDGRTSFKLKTPIGATEQKVIAKTTDGRIIELPIFVRVSLPLFTIVAEVQNGPYNVGADATILLPAGGIFSEMPLRINLAGAILPTGDKYQLKEKAMIQIGLKPRGGAGDAGMTVITIPRPQVIFDDVNGDPKLVINTILTPLIGNEPPNAPTQLMIRVTEPGDEPSAWVPLMAPDGNAPLLLFRTPTLKSILRDEAGLNLFFANTSNVLDVSLTDNGPAIATSLAPNGLLKVTLPGTPTSVFLRVGGYAGRLELKLPVTP